MKIQHKKLQRKSDYHLLLLMEKLKQKFMNTLAQLEINTIGIYQVE